MDINVYRAASYLYTGTEIGLKITSPNIMSNEAINCTASSVHSLEVFGDKLSDPIRFNVNNPSRGPNVTRDGVQVVFIEEKDKDSNGATNLTAKVMFLNDTLWNRKNMSCAAFLGPENEKITFTINIITSKNRNSINSYIILCFDYRASYLIIYYHK